MSRKGGIGEVGECMAISGPSFRNTLVDSGWATSVLLCTNRLRKVLTSCRVPISGREAFSQSRQAVARREL